MKQFYAVIYGPGKNWVEGKSMLEQPLDGHVAYVKNLSEDGTVLLAGPFLDDDGGLTILQADSLEEAHLIIAEDPDIREQVLQANVRCWAPFRLDSDEVGYVRAPLRVLQTSENTA
jgi:uncharacterized protein